MRAGWKAAYMTGLERNAGVITMASYAPLFANTEAWQWTPNDLGQQPAGFKGRRIYYRLQQLNSRNRGDAGFSTQRRNREIRNRR